MKKIWSSTVLTAAFVLFSLCLSNTAAAQYIWVDEKGIKQYSDMPPPASVPKSKVLKEPGRFSSITPTTGSGATAHNKPEAENTGEESSDSDKKRGPLTTSEKNAEFQKRRIEQREKDKKAAEQARLTADKSKHCERARAYQRSLQSGERLARTDQNGERYYLNDQQRAQETQETKRILEECK